MCSTTALMKVYHYNNNNNNNNSYVNMYTEETGYKNIVGSRRKCSYIRCTYSPSIQ